MKKVFIKLFITLYLLSLGVVVLGGVLSYYSVFIAVEETHSARIKMVGSQIVNNAQSRLSFGVHLDQQAELQDVINAVIDTNAELTKITVSSFSNKVLFQSQKTHSAPEATNNHESKLIVSSEVDAVKQAQSDKGTHGHKKSIPIQNDIGDDVGFVNVYYDTSEMEHTLEQFKEKIEFSLLVSAFILFFLVWLMSFKLVAPVRLFLKSWRKVTEENEDLAEIDKLEISSVS